MFYGEAAPSDELRPYVMSFWEFSVPDDASAPIDHEIFPDGCVSVYYHRNLLHGLHHMGISGLRLKSGTTTVSAGDTFWGLRIAPAACRAMLRCDPTLLVGRQSCDAAEFPHLTGRLCEKLAEVNNFAEALIIFETMLNDVAAAINPYDRVIAAAVQLIDQNHGEIRIDRLAATLHLSPRQLQRRFKACSGLTPKQFARIRRIRATAVILAENTEVNWADRAFEMGFSDQSHLAHEFVSVTKRSPNSFAKNVSRIEHGNLVK